MLRRSILAAPALALRAASEAEEILARAAEFDTGNYLALKPYMWNSEERAFRGKRQIRQQKYEINLLSGAMYWRKLEHNNQALRGQEKEAEDRRLRRHLESAASLDVLASTQWREERAYFEQLTETHTIERFESRVWDQVPCHYCLLAPRLEREGYAASFRIEAWLEKDSLHWLHSKWLTRRPAQWLFRQLPLGRLSMIYSNNIVNRGQLPVDAEIEWTLARVSSEPNAPWALQELQTRAGSFRNHLRYFNYRKYSSTSELIPC